MKLAYIKELIQIAYQMETNKVALLGIDSHGIKYLMLDTWCNTPKDRVALLRIIYKLIRVYPDKALDLTWYLVCNFSLAENGSDEVCKLYSVLDELSHLRLPYENQQGWNRTNKEVRRLYV